MNVYTTDKIRNVVLLGHGGSGKTTLAEAMSYLAGITSRMGRVEDGNTISDYDKEEIKRKFSISTSVIPLEWEGVKVNILDSPGYFDFVGEVEEAVAAADAAIIVVSGKAGVEVEMCIRDRDTHLLKAGDGRQTIRTLQKISNGSGAVGQRSEHNGAVGYGFVSRNPYLAFYMMYSLKVHRKTPICYRLPGRVIFIAHKPYSDICAAAVLQAGRPLPRRIQYEGRPLQIPGYE